VTDTTGLQERKEYALLLMYFYFLSSRLTGFYYVKVVGVKQGKLMPDLYSLSLNTYKLMPSKEAKRIECFGRNKRRVFHSHNGLKVDKRWTLGIQSRKQEKNPWRYKLILNAFFQLRNLRNKEIEKVFL